MKLLISTLLFLSLMGCNSSDDPGVFPVADSTADTENPTDDNSSGSEDPEDQNDGPGEEPELDFKWSMYHGKCFDDMGNVGLNKLHEGDCGDLYNSNLDGKDFTLTSYWGADMRGATLYESNIDLYQMSNYEVKFNLDTAFPEDMEKPFKQLRLNDSKLMKELNLQRKEVSKEYRKLYSANKKIKKQLRRNPANKEELLVKYNENSEELKKLKLNIDTLNRKKKRHKTRYRVHRGFEKKNRQR
jgi:hypothetical protein